MTVVTSKLAPPGLVPSGKMLVVIPADPGQVNSRFLSLIIVPFVIPVAAAPTVTVPIPEDASYWNPVTV